MGNCVSASNAADEVRKPASVIGSVGHLGSGNEDNVTVTSFGNESASVHNAVHAASSQDDQLGAHEGPQIVQTESEIENNRRGSFTPSIARSEEADGAVIQGYAEPHAFRLLRRQNDQSSIEALEKAVKDDPNLASTKIRVDGAPSRRPTALGVPNMQ